MIATIIMAIEVIILILIFMQRRLFNAGWGLVTPIATTIVAVGETTLFRFQGARLFSLFDIGFIIVIMILTWVTYWMYKRQSPSKSKRK